MNIQPLLDSFLARRSIIIHISIQLRRDIHSEMLLRIKNYRTKRKNPISNHLFVNDFICRIESLVVKNRNINLIILILFCRFSISFRFIGFFCAKIEFQHKNACQIHKCIHQRKYTCNTRISMPSIVNEREREMKALNKPFSALNDINNMQYFKGSLFILFCLNDFIFFFGMIQKNSFGLYIH